LASIDSALGRRSLSEILREFTGTFLSDATDAGRSRAALQAYGKILSLASRDRSELRRSVELVPEDQQRLKKVPRYLSEGFSGPGPEVVARGNGRFVFEDDHRDYPKILSFFSIRVF